MADINAYYAIEALPATTENQREILIDLFRDLGILPNSPQPRDRVHTRRRLDGNALIFEGKFNEDNLSISNVKQLMAAAFGISAATIDNANQQSQYGLVVTLSRNSTDYIRMAMFGYDGGWPTWNDSRTAAQAYIAANAAAWESEV